MRDIIEQYLEFAATETDKQGNHRAPTTLNSYRRALEGFATAVEQSGLGLEELPEDFLETAWMATQQSIHGQPIQLRVRVGALKQFSQWLFRNEIPCAPMRFPEVKIQPKPKPPKEETTMNNDAYLGDATLAADPIPSTQTIPPVQPAMQVAVPPPAPKKPMPQPKANPLAAMLPSSQYKLRVRRERELDEPVWVGDFPADRVAAAGAVEPFLGREVAPRMVAQGITGDVTFIVCSVGPNGQEVGERTRMTISCVPTSAQVQSVPAPVVGASAATVSANPSSQELADLLAQHRRAQEELEERLSRKMAEQQAAQVKAAQPKPMPVEQVRPQVNEEMEDLKSTVASLAGVVQALAQKLDERDRAPMMEYAPPPPPQPAAPQLDMVALMREMMAMTKAQQAPTPPPQPGLGEMFTMMAQAKQMFAPAQVNIDVSPLEEEIRELKKGLVAQAASKSRTMEMLEEVKAMKEVFSLVGGDSAPKPTNKLSNALGGLVEKIIENPAPLAEAVERILGATAQVQAAKTGAPLPPRPQPPPQPQVPPQVVQAAARLLDAAPGDATVIAAHEWLTLMGQVPAFAKVTEKISTFLREGKTTELGIYFRQVFAHLGLAEKAQPNLLSRIANDLVARVRGDNTEAEEQDEQDEGEEEEQDGPPDLTVRVGGASDQDDSSQDEEQDEAQDEEAEEQEEAPPADPRAYRMWLAERESASGQAQESEAQEPEAQEEPQVEEQPAVEAAEEQPEAEEASAAEEAPKKQRRKRRTKAEMAAARAAEILAQQEVANAEARG